MRTAELQSRLRALGLDPGPSDGIYGELTEEAVFDALDLYAPAVEVPGGLIPAEWVPPCVMERIICHWTAGAHTANATDLNYYHILIEGDGELCRGVYSIKDNVNTGDGRYAAHTKNCNTGSIGISLCGMAEATESPFSAGKYPINEKQWQTLARAIVDLCERYAIPVTRSTVLSHAEVQPTLGIAQSGKWDIARLPWDASVQGPIPVGDRMRAMVTA